MKKALFNKLENGLYEFSTSTFDLVDCLIVLYSIYPIKGEDKNKKWLGQKMSTSGHGIFCYLLTEQEKAIVEELYEKLLNETDDKIINFLKQYVVVHRLTLASHRENRFSWKP